MTMTKEAVERTEKEGRDTFYNDFSGRTQAIKFSDNLSCGVDFWSTGTTGTRSVGEIKRRNILSTKYPDYFLEKIKYDALMKYFEQGNEDKALYVNIFNDKYIIWDVSKITPIWKKEWCTATTAEDYGKIRVLKDVCLLKEEDALWTKPR